MENFEKMWNRAGFRTRWEILTNLGLNYKYYVPYFPGCPGTPLFSELPQKMQLDMLHTADTISKPRR